MRVTIGRPGASAAHMRYITRPALRRARRARAADAPPARSRRRRADVRRAARHAASPTPSSGRRTSASRRARRRGRPRTPLPPRALLRAPDRQRADAGAGRSLPRRASSRAARAVSVVHQDTAHTHAHVWLDARGVDGRKLHFDAPRLPAAGRGLGARVRPRVRPGEGGRAPAPRRRRRGPGGASAAAPARGRRPRPPGRRATRGARPRSTDGARSMPMPHLTRTDLEAINDALQAEIADLTGADRRSGDGGRAPGAARLDGAGGGERRAPATRCAASPRRWRARAGGRGARRAGRRPRPRRRRPARRARDRARVARRRPEERDDRGR